MGSTRRLALVCVCSVAREWERKRRKDRVPAKKSAREKDLVGGFKRV
jgi:hypothetical protein